MRLWIVFAAAAVLASPALAQEEGPERHFARADVAMREGNLEAAAKGFELVIREWPDDREFTPDAWIRLATCLSKMGEQERALRTLEKAQDRYRDDEDWLRRAHELGRRIREFVDAKKRREGFLRELHEFLGRRKAELSKEGLEGEELEQALREEKRRFIEKHGEERRGRDLDRLVALWKEQGVPPEEIESRVRRIEAERARDEAMRREFDDLVRRWQEEGLRPEEIERRRDEHRRKMEEAEEHRWRARHEDEMEEARHEFVRLAERLGIPAEAAERLIEEHSRPRHPRVPEEGLEARVRELEEHLHGLHEALEQRIRETHDGVARELGEVHEGMGREIDQRLGRLEREVAERIDSIEQRVAGALEDVVERLERIEERLAGRGERKRDR